jgi:hypothetical protein
MSVASRVQGREVPSTLHEPTQPVNYGSSAVAAPAKTPLPLYQQSLTSRGSSLGGVAQNWRWVGPKYRIDCDNC